MKRKGRPRLVSEIEAGLQAKWWNTERPRQGRRASGSMGWNTVLLDTVSQRFDWQHLMTVRFPASGFKSLRAYVNYEGVTRTPFKILVASMIGAVTGLIGGCFGSLVRRATGRRPQE